MNLQEWKDMTGCSLKELAERLHITRPAAQHLLRRGSHSAELACRVVAATNGSVTFELILREMRDPNSHGQVARVLEEYRKRQGLTKQDMSALLGYSGSGAKTHVRFKSSQAARVYELTEGMVTLEDLAETHKSWHEQEQEGAR